MKIIINGDDCGLSSFVNSRIENAILLNKITSTTILANMGDFEGAVSLYDKYKESISFGLHLNLTQGSPMLYSQQLLDSGFYKEVDGRVIFNSQPFRRSFLNSSLRTEIYKEVLAQATKLKDSNLIISHIDGHHFIHQAMFMLPLLPKLCKEIDVHKVRTYRNYMPYSVNRMLRECWIHVIKFQNPKICSANLFTSFQGFIKYENLGLRFGRENEVLELMTHPGGHDISEEEALLNVDISLYNNVRLINYNQL